MVYIGGCHAKKWIMGTVLWKIVDRREFGWYHIALALFPISYSTCSDRTSRRNEYGLEKCLVVLGGTTPKKHAAFVIVILFRELASYASIASSAITRLARIGQTRCSSMFASVYILESQMEFRKLPAQFRVRSEVFSNHSWSNGQTKINMQFLLMAN